MVIEKQLIRILQKLVNEDTANVTINGFDVSIRLFDDCRKLILSTPVYQGGNYIPISVRKHSQMKQPFNERPIKTFLHLHEDSFSIFLNYIGKLERVDNYQFEELLDEFCWQALTWQSYLDEHDRNDLVYVPVK